MATHARRTAEILEELASWSPSEVHEFKKELTSLYNEKRRAQLARAAGAAF